METTSDILKFAIAILSIINPLGALPVFLGFLQTRKNLNILRISNICGTAVATTILVSLLFGQAILNFFGISLSSFTIGGGFLIFMMAFSMISGHASEAKLNTNEIESVDLEREIGIVPLAIPLLSGPGSISTSIIQAKHFTTTYHWIGAFVVVILVGLLIKFMLMFAKEIGSRLGQIGINVMTRIMGLILLSISIEMVVSGVREMLPGLKGVF